VGFRHAHFRQVPLTQNSYVPQAFAQPPQFAGSVSTSTHAPPQEFFSGPQMQLPAWQIVPPTQNSSQPPQWVGSVCVSVQSAPQVL
jgi:hypothetical protein